MNSDLDLRQRNRSALDRAMANRLTKQLTPTTPPTEAVYLGYDTGNQRHQVRAKDGSTYYCLLESTGTPEIGSTCTLTLTRGGVPRIKTMPR
ncbi:hypothetical protein [Pantanalinema sp. GBBB05]|uniref:hypothetical protein n=1 Tax=Pantanalinema sp. GBBB05 TaxID=2604139 RepID=UPI001D99BA3B|nr:hypothetical protein [Pantanalinema sp. GBBB05]